MIYGKAIITVSIDDKYFNDFEKKLTKEDGWSKTEDTRTVTWTRSCFFETDIDEEEEEE